MGWFSKKKKTTTDKAVGRNSDQLIPSDVKKSIDATHMAAYGGLKEYLIPFIQESRDVTLRNEDGNTLLHTAAEGWQFEMVEFLILSGADVNALNNNGDTPLIRLIRDCKNTPHEVVLQSMSVTPEEAREKTIELLVRSTDLSIRNRSGSNALHLASNFGDSQTLFHLLIHGSDLINEQNEKRMTPLAYASLFDHPKCVKMLVLHGANPWQIIDTDKDGGDVYPLRFMVSSEKPEMKAIVQDIKDRKQQLEEK